MSDIQTSTRTQVSYEISHANETFATQDRSLHSDKEDITGTYTYRAWCEIPVGYVEDRAHLLTNKAYGRESIMELVAQEHQDKPIYYTGSYKLREVKKTTTVETSDDEQGNTFRSETVTDETTVFYTHFRTEEEFKAVMEDRLASRARWAKQDAEEKRIEAEVQSRVEKELAKVGKSSKKAAEDDDKAKNVTSTTSAAPKKSFLDRILGR